jgi:glucose 1-dehydrogenase
MSGGLGLQGRCGLVAAGTSQLGRACVERLRDEGMAIAFTGADREHGHELAQRTGAAFLDCDPGDRAAVDEAAHRAPRLLGGRLDLLVTCPELLLEGSIEATPDDDFRALIEADLTSAFRLARACLPPMRAGGGGSIVQIAASAGIRAAHETAAYSVVSAGLIAVAELLAAEGAPDGVRANAVCPGGTERVPPSGRAVTGADVAAVVAWLASEQSGHMTGATLRLDGGEGAAMLLDTRGP